MSDIKVFKNALLIDGISNTPLKEAMVIVEDSKIRYAGTKEDLQTEIKPDADVFDLQDIIEVENSIVLQISSCPAHAGTQKAGYESEYQCACFKRCDGWFEAVGLTYSSFIRKSLTKGDKFCEIVMTPDK